MLKNESKRKIITPNNNAALARLTTIAFQKFLNRYS